MNNGDIYRIVSNSELHLNLGEQHLVIIWIQHQVVTWIPFTGIIAGKIMIACSIVRSTDLVDIPKLMQSGNPSFSHSSRMLAVPLKKTVWKIDQDSFFNLVTKRVVVGITKKDLTESLNGTIMEPLKKKSDHRNGSPKRITETVLVKLPTSATAESIVRSWCL